ncbi:Peroxidase [Pleurostoma richardsiae]|uniref:Peroxidase n=1 Tax=Pleurostoma richardsiae TaxID=41990 RepID=A0AA38RII8_9PEZI|nr:Peroxidase [Pleurostoma richardsiae]
MRDVILFFILAAGLADAYAGMGRVLAELRRKELIRTRSTSLLGDLLELVDGVLTAAGQEIKEILEGTASALADSTTYKAPGDKDSDECKADTCCIWSYIASDMVPTFTDGAQCSALARGAIRLGFHDAGAWNSSMSFGGADGSILLSGELTRPENNGLSAIAEQATSWFNGYKTYGITMADLIQIGSLVATVTCPGGPRIRAFVGRKDNNTPPPQGLMPSPFQDAPALVELFEAKTFTANDLVALVGAHSVSQQFFVDTSKAGAPQDTTDGVWDVKFYSETSSSETPDGVFKFPSDVSLSQDSTTSTAWRTFAASESSWAAAYAPAYFRMSLLGVSNLNDLTDCTKILPLPR